MAVAGQLLIEIAADTKELKQGLNKASAEVKGFSSQMRASFTSIRKEMRLVNQVLAGAGVVTALHGITRQFEAVAAKAKEVGEASQAAGMSIEEFSGGRWSSSTVSTLGAITKDFEELHDALLAMAADLLAVLSPAIKAVVHEVKRVAESPVRGLDWLTNPGAAAGRWFAGGGGGKTKIDAQTEAAQMAQDAAMRRKIIDASTKAGDERRAKEAAEAAQHAEKLDAWKQKEEQRLAQIELDAMHAEEERLKRLEKLREEDANRRAQWAIDAMKEEDEARKAEEEARQKKLEDAANIIEGRGGIGALERGTQAAFSAMNRRDNIPNQQLTELKGIRRAVEREQEEPLETADL